MFVSGGTYEVSFCWKNSRGQEAHCANKGEKGRVETATGMVSLIATTN